MPEAQAALHDKRLLLLICGGIAAYKSLELIRLAQAAGAQVQCILTASGARFITPLSVSSLSGLPVRTDLFDAAEEARMGHIQLSREADLVVVAPATADLLARMAAGRSDDLAAATLLATTAPVLVAPAMNVRMWQHRATMRNMAVLRGDGIAVVGPGEGDMACGEHGAGRMAEPAEILDAITALLARGAQDCGAPGTAERPLAGRRALVTSGPTQESLDPVRYLGNRSSGRQGHAIAGALVDLGAQTTLVSGPSAVAPPAGAQVRQVETARDMLAACRQALPVDVVVCAAAVADFRPARTGPIKAGKREAAGPGRSLPLVENPDILAALADARPRPALVVGFAAETGAAAHVLERARAKRRSKGCDWIVANDVSPGTGVMGGTHNQVHLVTAADCESWEQMSKTNVAQRLARRIAEHLCAEDAP